MIPLIQQAIAVGWTAKQILNFISGKMKNFIPGLENARKSGYSDDDILKFIQGKIKVGKVKEPETVYGKYLKQSGILTPEESKQRKAKGIKAAIGAGSTALAAYGAYRQFGPQISNILGGSTPTQGPTPVAPPQLPPGAPGGPPPGAQPGITPQQATKQLPGLVEGVGPEQAAKGLERAKLTLQAEGEALKAAEAGLSETDQLARRYLDKKKLGNRLRTMKKAGKSREEMIEFLKKKMPVMEQEYIRSIGFTGEPGNLDERLGEMVDAYFPLQKFGKKEEMPIQVNYEEKPTEEIKNELPPVNKDEIKKGIIVGTPNGVGTVEAFDGSGALVNIDGKVKKVSFDELMGETETVKQAKIVIDPKEVPEPERSASLGFVMTSPSKKDIQISYGPTGKFYRYWRKDGQPIDDKTIELLKEGQKAPITSGETYMGFWDADVEDSRGTIAYHDLVRHAQKFGEEDKTSKKIKGEDIPLTMWYEELDNVFVHGYINKFLKELQFASKAFKKKKKKK